MQEKSCLTCAHEVAGSDIWQGGYATEAQVHRAIRSEPVRYCRSMGRLVEVSEGDGNRCRRWSQFTR